MPRNQTYARSTAFEYAATDNGEDPGTDSFQYKAADSTTNLLSVATVTSNGEEPRRVV